MAISRHKVLSEMQQQLEMASSKCGNLQKQLEIVKDKVRQSSTTNLLYVEPPENKENKMTNGETQISETEREHEYEKALSISSTSTEDANEERDVNIIKVFYDRLGQMDYPKGQVELSDISSDGNDLDIDQLLSTVNLPVERNGSKNKRKEKRGDKKSKERREKVFAPIKRTSKGKINPKTATSPYENTMSKLVKQPASKRKTAKLVQKSVEASDSYISASNKGVNATKPKFQQKEAKVEQEKVKKKKVPTFLGTPVKAVSKNKIQEPTKKETRNELRKSKSSTVSERRDTFSDTRSLTRLLSDASPEVIVNSREHELKVPSKDLLNLNSEGSEKILVTPQEKKRSVTNNGLKTVQPDRRKYLKEEDFVQKKDPQVRALAKTIKYQETLAPDIASSLSTVNQKIEAPVPGKTFVSRGQTVNVGKESKLKRPAVTSKIPLKSVGTQYKVSSVRKKIDDVEEPKEIKLACKVPNGVASRQSVDHQLKGSDVKRRVDLYEKVVEAPKDRTVEWTMGIKGKMTSTKNTREPPVPLARTNSSVFDASSRRGPPSLASTLPQPTVKRDCPEFADPLSHIKKMKDNFMKFNAIPFIVGQSTSRSYHIGLNIQETYSLFKQTPSMTALMVSKHSEADHQSSMSRARSTRSGYTGRRSVSSARVRESCPACYPVPELSPEQKADPWFVPQDEAPVLRVCTCFPKRMVSFEQVINQLYFTNMNVVKLHPSFLSSRDGILEEPTHPDGKDKLALSHKTTNTLYYTQLLRKIQHLKENIMG